MSVKQLKYNLTILVLVSTQSCSHSACSLCSLPFAPPQLKISGSLPIDGIRIKVKVIQHKKMTD